MREGAAYLIKVHYFRRVTGNEDPTKLRDFVPFQPFSSLALGNLALRPGDFVQEGFGLVAVKGLFLSGNEKVTLAGATA